MEHARTVMQYTGGPDKPLRLHRLEMTANEMYMVFRHLEKLGQARTPVEDRVMEKMRVR